MKKFLYFFFALVVVIIYSCEPNDGLMTLPDSGEPKSSAIDSIWLQAKDELPDQDTTSPNFVDYLKQESELTPRSPLYEWRGISATSPLDFCKVVFDEIEFSNGQHVAFNATIIQNNTVDPVACQAFVEDVRDKIVEFYGICLEVKLHASIETVGGSRTMRWYLCIGDASGIGSVVEDITTTVVSGPCATPFNDQNTYVFFEDVSCAPVNYGYVAGCRYERISLGVIPGSDLWWTDASIDWIKTNDGTVYPNDVPLLVAGFIVPGDDAAMAQAFQQAVYSSYGLCFDSRAKFFMVESNLVFYLGLGSISPGITYLDSWGLYLKDNLGRQWYWKYSINEHQNPGLFEVLDTTCP